MASKTSVTVEIGAKVTGDDDLADFAKALGKIPDDLTTKVEADVTGDDLVAGLSKDLDALPTTTDTKVDATVSGADKVSGLSDDIDALPASTTTKVTTRVDATVTGDREVASLAGDIDGLPATTKSKVEASLSGQGDIDRLVTQLQGLPPSKNISLNASFTSTGPDLKQKFKDVDKAAEDARDETAGFASEMTGTLGGQFSEGTGIVSDFAEQFRNLRDRVRESDDKIGTVAKAAAGIGGTLIAGFGIDAIIGLFSQMNESAETTKANIKALADQIVESGGLIDNAFIKMQAQQIIEDPGFQALIDKGADYNDTLNGLLGDTEALGRVHEELATKAQASAEAIRQAGGSEEQAQAAFQDTQTLDDLSGKFKSTGDSAIKSGRQFARWQVEAGLTEDKAGKAANGVDVMGKAMQDAEKDTKTATASVKVFNSTDLDDKDAALTTTDTATGDLKTYNKLEMDDKTGQLKATDTATGKVKTYNTLKVDDKTGKITAVDNATGKVVTFNQTKIHDKTATLHADTQPAKDEIDALDGRSVTVPVNVRIQNLTPAQQQRLFGETFSSSSFNGASPAPAPRVGVSTTAAAVPTVPITITVNGALDPVSTARQIQQVLTRAERRVKPFRTGGRHGVQQAPV